MNTRAVGRILYALAVFAVGSAISILLVRWANQPHRADEEAAPDKRQFADHIRQLESWFEDYRNQERHFHTIEIHPLLPLGQQEACLTCHPLFPHTKDAKRRAFYNQHSHFLSCLACHLDDESRGRTRLEWTTFGVENSITARGPYGLERLENGGLTGAGNYISRMVPVLSAGGSSTLLFTPYDDKRYQAFRADAEGGLEIDEAEFREFAEEHVGDKPLACLSCHAPETEFPWSPLGFSQGRIHELTHSAAVGMVENYEPFHFPILED
ncbi:MAG: hypothetical protein Q8O14_08600 [bacterium]|jgi:hypothetical protein|nr:hypothetical protein [bacterium]